MSHKRRAPEDGSSDIASVDISASEEEEEEEEFHVEVITKARVADDGKFEYFVKWYGYSSDDDSWEPEDNLTNCDVLLKKFWKHVPDGKEKKSNPGQAIGNVFAADSSWIEKERVFFFKSLKKEKELAKHKKEEKERQRKEDLARSKQVPQKAIKLFAETDAPSRERQADLVNSLFDESDSDEQPLSARATSLEMNKGKSKATASANGRGTAVATSSKPKTQLKPIAPLPPPPTFAFQRNRLSGLKIPKKSATAPQAPPAGTSPTDRMDVDSPIRNAPPSALSPMASERPNIMRPQNQSNPTPRPNNTTTAPVFTSTKPPPAAVSPVNPVGAEEVDNFMATIMSFNDSIAQNPENLPQPPVANDLPMNDAIRIDNKWKWTGILTLDTADALENICDVTITSSYNVADPGFRLNALLGSKGILRFSKVYNRFETESIVGALKKVDQIARISHSEEKDRSAFTTLMKYMKAGNLAIAAPVITDYGHVAQMIVFPAPKTTQVSALSPKTLSQYLFQSLVVPSQYLDDSSLIVVLMPWIMKASQYSNLSFKSDELNQTTHDEELKKCRSASTPIVITPKVERVIRILGFPEWFLSFMPTRTYCIWAFPVEPMPKDSGKDFSAAARRETVSLLFLLKHLKAQNVGYKADVRVIFVHVGALRTLNKLPALADRRCKRPEIQFITYGSHESVKPIFWGFEQIFPVGGVVTFTFTALLENPVAIADIIERISSHRLWSCYILPSVLSMFIRLGCPGSDPVTTYTAEPWRVGRILTLIDEGKLALMQSPPIAEQTSPGSDTNACEEWIAAQYACASKTSVDIVKEAWELYKANRMDKSEDGMKRQGEVDIVKDLISLQMQPYIRRNFRRFVVIKAMQDTHIPYDRDGFEWRTVQDFDFRDHYNSARASVEPSPL